METIKPGIVEELKAKYKGRLAQAQKQLKRQMGKPHKGSTSYISDVLLFWKWAYRVGKDWYGFNLGDIPEVWTNVLDDFLAWLDVHCPDFQIHQVKMKLGSLRFYINTRTDGEWVNDIVRVEISQLRKLLSLPPYTPKPLRAARRKRQQHSRKK